MDLNLSNMTHDLPDKKGYWWCQPFFGVSQGIDMFGAPRPVLVFIDEIGRPYILGTDNIRGYLGHNTDYWAPMEAPEPAVPNNGHGGHTRAHL